jgi:hypothetical protein
LGGAQSRGTVSLLPAILRVFQANGRFAGGAGEDNGSHRYSIRRIQSTARDEFNTLVLGIFAGRAILLASSGLDGLMAYSMEQRTLEFGIRPAFRKYAIGWFARR